jgi:hypothetical protein
MPVRRVRSSLLPAFLSLAVTTGAVAQECSSGTLTLEARAAVTLPITYGVDGVVTGPDAEVALWSAEGELFRFAADGRERHRQLPLGLHTAGVALEGEAVRLLDGWTGREYLLDADTLPPPSDSIALGVGETIDRAVRLGGVWLIGIRHAPSREYRVVSGGRVLFRSAAGTEVRTTPRYHLTRSGEGVLLTNLIAPFDVLRLSATGAIDTLVREAASALTGRITPDALPHWRALPAIELDCGLLLTLTDLTSDARLLLRFGVDGGLVRVVALDAPLGLIMRLPGERSLLAARRAGGLELVWYTWRWNDDPPHGTH